MNRDIKIQEIKTIITDFDETLWSGVIAEGEKPKINRDYYNFLANLWRKGVVIFGLTKNDDSDVNKTFSELKLNKNIFVTIIASWKSKAYNVELLFQQLELRPDTTFFIDDNPLELNEVKSKIPNILVLNSKNWVKLQDNAYLKKAISTSKSVADRYKKYRHALQLFKAKNQFKGSDKAFLYSRKRSIQIGEPRSKKELERVAELFYRTNRLNIYRRPLSSINEATEYLENLKESGHNIYAVSVKDGGEPLGIQAAFTAVSQGKKTLISNGTISCSMISFGDFEKKILNELFKHFLQTSNSIEILVKETPTNYRIRKILKEFKFKIKKQYKNKYRFYLNKKDFKEHDVPWIKLEKKGKVSYKYFGVPPIKSYFLKHEWKKVKQHSKIVVLGVGQGETLGIDLMRKFIKHLKSLKAKYLPIDLENYGNNIVANAENLHKIFRDESVDYILCNELLEHTEHYWEVINEMLRILRIKGRIFFSVPYNYPPHEYPIDKWRLSYPYLKKVFGKFCKIERVELVGNRNKPRHIIMSLVKTKKFDHPIKPVEGKVDWETGLIYI